MFSCISILFPFFPISALFHHLFHTFKSAPFSITIFMGGIPPCVSVYVHTYMYMYMNMRDMREGGKDR